MNDKRLLLVEDDESTALMMSYRLAAHGWEVTVAYRGVEALEMQASAHPAVCVMDLGLPDMDGLELVQKLNAGRHRATRLLVLSGRTDVAVAEAARRAGADAYLLKPVELSELLLALEGEAEADAFDPTLVVSWTDGDRHAAAQVVERFLIAQPDYLAAITNAAQCGDVIAMQKAAHKVAGALLYMGCESASQLARRLEASTTVDIALIRELEHEFDAAAAEMREWINA